MDEDRKNKLPSISSATIDRILKPTRIKAKGRGLSGTKPGTLLKNRIDIKTVSTRRTTYCLPKLCNDMAAA